MAERIDLPANFWSSAFAKCIIQISISNERKCKKYDFHKKTIPSEGVPSPQAPCKLVNCTLVIGRGFIVHRPGAADEFQSSLLHELIDLFTQFGRLFAPPFEEKCRLNIYETLIRISQQLLDHGIDDQFHIGPLDKGAATIIVLVDGFQPADVVMSVRHNMNVQHIRFRLWTSLSTTEPLKNSKSVPLKWIQNPNVTHIISTFAIRHKILGYTLCMFSMLSGRCTQFNTK